MPKISISVSDYTYWKLLGSGETVSSVIQKALQEYWNPTKTRKPVRTAKMIKR